LTTLFQAIIFSSSDSTSPAIQGVIVAMLSDEIQAHSWWVSGDVDIQMKQPKHKYSISTSG
jgi:hypothetical protein